MDGPKCRLTAASFARLNTLDPDRTKFASDARFVINILPTLTVRRDQVQQLRQTILGLAMRGRLVPQDRGDESASELVARFARQKALERAGRHWTNGLPDVTGAMFPVPRGWAWSRLGDTVERVTVGYVGPMKDEYVQTGVPFLRSQNVRPNRFESEGLVHISEQFHRKIIKSALAPDDVVVVRSGNVGTACVVPDTLSEANCSDLVVVKRPTCVLATFLSFYLNSLAASHVQAGAVGVALTHFNTKSVATMPIPIPPLPEQRRIVAKIHELMALCDRLEMSLSTAETTRSRLLDALLADALAPVANELQATN